MKLKTLIVIGANIRKYREDKTGLSQEAFARKIGMHRTYQSHVERGIRNISAFNLVKIAQELGVEVGELFPSLSELEKL